MANSKRDKLLNQINKNLDEQQRQLFKMIKIEQRKEKFVFRMPVGFFALDDVWDVIAEQCKVSKVEYQKAGIYATLDELDDLFGNVEWLWNPWIPRGFITMVAGDPGMGKSGFVLDIIRMVTNNVCFPLCESSLGRKGKALWIDTEASQQLLTIRSKSMKVDRSRCIVPDIDGDILTQPNLGDPNHRQQIIETVEGFEPDIIVLDSLGGSHDKGENKVEDIKPVMQFFALLSQDKGISTIMIHHLNKGREGESTEVSLYRLRGSTAIPQFSRSIIAMEPGVDKLIKLRNIKNNLARQPDPISARILNDSDENIIGFEYMPYSAPPPKRTKKESCAEWVTSFMKKQKYSNVPIPFTTLVDAASEEGFNRSILYEARKILGDQLTVGGTGNSATWMLSKMENDTESINKIRKANGAR